MLQPNDMDDIKLTANKTYSEMTNAISDSGHIPKI